MKRRSFVMGAMALPAMKIERAANIVASLGQSTFAAKFFTAAEWGAVRVLVDDIIPRDERSGSATEAKVPEFMDTFLADPEIPRPLGIEIRSGLEWLETESRRRFGKSYADVPVRERHGLLSEIAWPTRAKPELQRGVAFFNRFRDFTASGFWSSAIGHRDLEYQGGVFVAEWKGCPEAALKKLGVSYGL